MKLLKFRIRNYKSIIDSGDCYLDDKITILAGKNESGKTSILEALRDFSVDREIIKDAEPIHLGNAKPEIVATFSLTKGAANQIFESIGHPGSVANDSEIELVKKFPSDYSLGATGLGVLNNADIDSVKKSLTSKMVSLLDLVKPKNKGVWDNLKRIREYISSGAAFSDSFNTWGDFSSYIESLHTTPEQISNDQAFLVPFRDAIANVKSEMAKLDKYAGLNQKIIDALKKRIPNFIWFESFGDSVTNTISFSELEGNEWINHLSAISGLDAKLITGSDEREKQKHKISVNKKLKRDYRRFWTQDKAKLKIDWESGVFYLWIHEGQQPYEPDKRSKGRQWHLTFYLKVSARAKDGVSNVILIDEPGLYLHATAQKDILNNLEDAAEKSQIIFSTHSPYLIELDKLDRVQLITKDADKGTRVIAKAHAHADKETLTPITTAIGVDLNSGVLNETKVKNVVVEGISDFHYIHAFKQIKGFDNMLADVNFIASTGVGTMPIIGAILSGWGAKVVYLLDQDKGKKPGVKNLTKKWRVPENSIIFIPKEGGSIEDILSRDDFGKFAHLENKKQDDSVSNSEYLKANKPVLNKVSLSIKFLQACRSNKVNLQDETKSNVKKLFERIENAFRQMDEQPKQQENVHDAATSDDNKAAE